MASTTYSQIDTHHSLNTLVRGWNRRLRLRQTTLWLPFSLAAGLGAGVVMLLFARTRPWLPNEQIILITAVLVVASVLAMLVGVWMVWLSRRTRVQSAQRFDLLFNLRERVSTALELGEGRIHANDELTDLQLRDAWDTAQNVNARAHLPLVWNWRAWLGVALLLGAFIVLLLIPNPQSEAANSTAATQVAIEEATDELERITQDVASDTELTAEQRESLLEELEKSTDVLQEPEVEPEQALAALSNAESELQERADELGQSAEEQRAAMEQAAEALREMSGAPTEEQTAQEQSAASALEQIGQNVPQMTEQQQMQAADALEQAAEALQNTNPQAAQALREAAEALRNGDMQAAQEAIQEAAQQLQAQQQQMQAQQQAAQQMQQNAQQLQQAGQQITGQPQSSQQQNQQGQQSSDAMEQVQSLSQQQQGQQSQQAQGQQQGQQGNDTQQSEQGQQAGEGQQGGDQGMIPSEGQQGQQTTMSEQEGSEPGTGGGAGDMQGNAGDESSSGEPGGQRADQNNNPDGTGTSDLPLVYAPRRIGGENGEVESVLEPDASNMPVQEGEFAENPDGQALVPYSEVFSDYRDAANRALESDYIPLGLRDVVRDYFTSLEPGQNQNDER
jgi:hypothetical protein